MNCDILVKVLKTQYSGSTAINVFELLVPTIVKTLTLDEFKNIMSLSCFNYNDDKEKAIFLLLNEKKIDVTIEILEEIMKYSIKYDNAKMLNKLSPYMKDSIKFKDIKKYIDSNIDEKSLYAIINKFQYNDINIEIVLELIKGSSITDKIREDIIYKHYIYDFTPDMLSNYFSDYDIYARICKKMFDKDKYEKYKEKIEEDNSSVIIFDMKHLVDQFTIDEPYTIRNNDKGESIILTITRKSKNNIQIEYNKNYKSGFLSFTTNWYVVKGIIINLDGSIERYK